MNIALDYDGTYDRDPGFWESFIALAQAKGHTVMCVTKREPTLDTPAGILFNDGAQVQVRG